MKLHHTLLASATLFACLAVQAQTVSITPSLSNVNLGDTFSVDVAATGFPDKIFGGGYNLAFDPAILQLNAITIPASWEFATSTGLLDPASGTVSDVYFNTFVAPIKGDFLTATLQFTAVGSGTSAISVSESGSFPFGNELGNPVAVTYVNGSVNVAAVPEPSSLTLMLAGVACMGLIGWRKRA
ncbi:cohesin domain-containing protein [Aquabacterium sp. NJ1]|uniref:cohesin domain-containing protein n=1 Tax=Aquabacterium sp. NJ1 TaxID=1538295 RepID=UPI001377F0EA|nr:cohesin domain-containing protein [Aquabacterium sp. NJ1]